MAERAQRGALLARACVDWESSAVPRSVLSEAQRLSFFFFLSTLPAIVRDCGHSGASTNVYFSGFDEIRGLILRDGEGEIDQSAGGNVNCVCCILDSGIFLCNMKLRVTH